MRYWMAAAYYSISG